MIRKSSMQRAERRELQEEVFIHIIILNIFIVLTVCQELFYML